MTVGAGWIRHIAPQIPQAAFVGIDEETGIIREGGQGAWQVYGGGNASIYRNGLVEVFVPGQRFTLP